jgi:plastocyanin
MRMRFLAVTVLGVLLALVATLAAARLSDGAPPDARVGIADFQFLPATLTVPAGTRVTWVNREQEIHTVTSATGAFASPALEKGDTFSYTFTTPGTYDYFCALHPRMTSTITVK